jgi:hypothetical protein
MLSPPELQATAPMTESVVYVPSAEGSRGSMASWAPVKVTAPTSGTGKATGCW